MKRRDFLKLTGVTGLGALMCKLGLGKLDPVDPAQGGIVKGPPPVYGDAGEAIVPPVRAGDENLVEVSLPHVTMTITSAEIADCEFSLVGAPVYLDTNDRVEIASSPGESVGYISSHHLDAVEIVLTESYKQA